MFDYHGKPLVKVWIEGDGPYAFVYDTGNPVTLVDNALLGLLGVAGPYEVVTGGKVMTADRFTFAKLAAAGFEGIDGNLGSDVVRNFVVNLDCERARCWLSDGLDEEALSACEHTEETASLADLDTDDYHLVRGTADDIDGWFLVDSRATLDAISDPVFDAISALHSRPAMEAFYTRALMGTFWAQLTSLAYLEVAGQRVENIVTRTVPQDVIGLEKTISTPVTVTQVMAGSSAEEQGVLVGDEIVAVMGYNIGGLSPTQWAWAFVSPEHGFDVLVTLVRNGESHRMTLETRALLHMVE